MIEWETPETILQRKELALCLDAAMKVLPVRTVSILSLFFGLYGVAPLNKAEISRIYMVSPSRIGSIAVAALCKLSRKSAIKSLASEYLDA